MLTEEKLQQFDGLNEDGTTKWLESEDFRIDSKGLAIYDKNNKI